MSTPTPSRPGASRAPAHDLRATGTLRIEVILCQALFFLLDPHRYGGRNIHLSPLLESHVLSDRVAESYFGHPPMGKRLQLPGGSAGPDPKHLRWHRERIFKRAPASDAPPRPPP